MRIQGAKRRSRMGRGAADGTRSRPRSGMRRVKVGKVTSARSSDGEPSANKQVR